MASVARRLAAMPEAERRAVLAGLSTDDLEQIEYAWPIWARPDQLPPQGSWRTWLLLGGRGSGKTRSAAEWCRAEIESGKRRYLGIIGPTADAVRRIMVEGPSGILAVAPPWCRPSYEPSRRLIAWPNGAVAHLFSAEEPDRLRGPNLDGAWLDELASYPTAEQVWDMTQMCLRLSGPLGDAPRAVVSTTPRPLPLLKRIMTSSSTVLTRARTLDNAANLDATTLRYLTEKYSGSRLGRQELDAEFLEDVVGALWRRENIDAARIDRVQPYSLRRIVVAVDPAVSNNEGSDETGIIVTASDDSGHGYVLSDRSCRASPDAWARAAVAAYHQFAADRVIGEVNNGGALIESVLRTVAPNIPYTAVRASRGKVVRAEPAAALYEQGRIHHVGSFPELEDQMCAFTSDFDRATAGFSPDRLDALVWGLTELLVQDQMPRTVFF